MATFVYKAYDQLGNKKAGKIAVPSEMDARRELRDHGLSAYFLEDIRAVRKALHRRKKRRKILAIVGVILIAAAMFMSGAILGRAFKLTGDTKYAGILADFLLAGKIQQDHGLFWHCRSAAYYWGRGNGFAAMGLAESLTYLPEDHAQRPAIVAMYGRLMESLRRLQHPSGMLNQVLDIPGSYLEFTATCMMGYSMARGIRMGFLSDDFRESLDLAWQGVSERIDDVGNVVDGCASTGVQNNVREYLDRPAIFGFDDRSGGLALWFAVEMERLARGI